MHWLAFLPSLICMSFPSSRRGAQILVINGLLDDAAALSSLSIVGDDRIRDPSLDGSGGKSARHKVHELQFALIEANAVKRLIHAGQDDGAVVAGDELLDHHPAVAGLDDNVIAWLGTLSRFHQQPFSFHDSRRHAAANDAQRR